MQKNKKYERIYFFGIFFYFFDLLALRAGQKNKKILYFLFFYFFAPAKVKKIQAGGQDPIFFYFSQERRCEKQLYAQEPVCPGPAHAPQHTRPLAATKLRIRSKPYLCQLLQRNILYQNILKNLSENSGQFQVKKKGVQESRLQVHLLIVINLYTNLKNLTGNLH